MNIIGSFTFALVIHRRTKDLFMFKAQIFLCLILATQIGLAQSNQSVDTVRQKYLAEQKKLGRAFSDDFYPKFSVYYSLSEKDFVARIESARSAFDALLKEYGKSFDVKFVEAQQAEIKYYFDKLILDYPSNHHTYSGKKVSLSSKMSGKLQKNLADFNKPELLTNSDFTEYARAFLSYRVDSEIKKPVYRNQDNQRLNAVWRIIPSLFTNQQTINFWKYDYLSKHIDNLGIKNIGGIYEDFKATCRNPTYLSKVNHLYNADWQGRQGHLAKTYKTVGSVDLDVHLFLPDSSSNNKPRPVIVFFHGGSWSEGKPDYFFEACRRYAQKGWVAAAIEYRLSARHNTLPFAAVMDAKSAIRWLRKNADELDIDTGKIIASGNSAGGHLVLATALADKWNEMTDDLRFSSVPDVLLVNAGVYDLTDERTAWIGRDLKDKNLVKEISPNHLVKKNLPPTLLIHGTADRNCPYSTAEYFKSEMDKASDSVKLYSLEGAGHFIWFDPKFVGQVSKVRDDFLRELGF